jgi:predicted ATPase/class 3 adenylate cyclase
MNETHSFGYWVRRRRKALDLTQAELAARVGCAEVTIRRIEADERRPSRQIAQRLADQLDVPPDEQLAFIQAARAELGVDRLAPASPAVVHEALGSTTAPAAAAASASPNLLPSGTVTFLFTDIEGSTQLWEQHPQAMSGALARHEALLHQAIGAHGGVVVKHTGDGMHAAFARPTDAVHAALAAQRSLAAEVWGSIGSLRVRMALHTGVSEERDGDYFGVPLNRVARLLATGHGGQVLLSRATQELVREQLPQDVDLRDLGAHRLKDLSHPEQIFQLLSPDLPAAFPPLNALDPRRTNLPAQPTLLIGREQDVAAVCARLRRPEVRLLTLTGPGGTGKTRLGLQVAAELLDAFVDGVYFVDLAPIGDANLVASRIAQALGVQETAARPLVDSLKDYLREKRSLLLLDNFEQVLDAALLIPELLAAAPNLKILVTSREVLHLRGEKEFLVPPLELPDLQLNVAREALSQYAAVQLFIARALDVKSDFAVTKANAPAVAEICARLDGLPLAIELAAVRIKLFSPQALLLRLSSRLTMLTGGSRDLPTRHQTLRSTIDWSYNLLDESDKILFARLSVFVGSCTLEAAAAVCNADGDLLRNVVESMASLTDKSLLRHAEGQDGEPRFMMLETVREYALERLAVSGAEETIRQRHANYYLGLVEQAESKLRGSEQIVWFDRLEIEHDNLRTALNWTLGTAGETSVGLRLVGVLWWFWQTRGYWNEGRMWIDRVLAASDRAPTVVRAQALFGASRLTGDPVQARESLMMFRNLGDQEGVAWALNSLANTLYYSQGNAEQALPLLEESVAQFRELGDIYGVTWALGSLGYVLHRQGDNQRALALLEESLELAREQGDTYGIAWRLTFLAWIARDQGNYSRARALSEAGLLLLPTLRDKLGLAQVLDNLGHIAIHQGEQRRAVECFEKSLSLFEALGDKHGYARVLLRLGELARLQGNDTQALRHCNAALTLYQEERNDPAMAWARASLGYIALQQHNNERAEALFTENLILCRNSRDKLSIGACLTALAEIGAEQGKLERAARLLGAADLCFTASGGIKDPITHIDYDRVVIAARTLMDEATFATAWAEGHAMTLEQAIAYALDEDNQDITS